MQHSTNHVVENLPPDSPEHLISARNIFYKLYIYIYHIIYIFQNSNKPGYLEAAIPEVSKKTAKIRFFDSEQ